MRIFYMVTFLFAGVSAGIQYEDYQLRGQTRQQLLHSESECTKSERERYDQIGAAIFNAMACQHAIFGSSYSKSNNTDDPVKIAEEACKNRVRLLECTHFLIEYVAPCNASSIQAQVEDLKTAATELFSFCCDDDIAKIREFSDDGGFTCIVEKNKEIERCMVNLMNFINFNVPMFEDITTLEAVDICHRYDEMASCVFKLLDSCPKPSSKQFVEKILSMVRQGTYCHITVPMVEGNVDDNVIGEQGGN